MAATTGHSINTGPYRENTEIYYSLKLLHWLNLNCASIIGRSFTNFVFFMLIVRWLPVHSFYIGPIGFFMTRWTIQALESLWFIIKIKGKIFKSSIYYLIFRNKKEFIKKLLVFWNQVFVCV
jgi:hypothetical protein